MSPISLSKADISVVEEQFVLDALRSGWIAPLGPHVDAFEAEIAERTGVRAALALSSGTAALHLGLLEVGARAGAVVLVPTMTFAASAYAVVYTGATPIFVDADPSDGNVSPELLVGAIDTLRAEGVRPAAAMTVDLFGRCADYDAISGPLAERGVALIEDAAEALGAACGPGAAGSFGRVAALSFNGNKIMTTSGGGMLLSDDVELIQRCRYLSSQARQPLPFYEHHEIGYNYRLSNVLAALGRAQLTRLDAMMARRRAIRERYVHGLGDIPAISFLGPGPGPGPGRGPDRRTDNCWLTCLTLDPALAPINADKLIAGLADAGIEARHLWKPMHLQPVFANARAFVTGAAQRLFDRGVALPSGSALDDADIDVVIEAVRTALGS